MITKYDQNNNPEIFKFQLKQQALQKRRNQQIKPKRPSPWLFPIGLEKRYQRIIRGFINNFIAVTTNRIKPLLGVWQEENKQITGDDYTIDESEVKNSDTVIWKEKKADDIISDLNNVTSSIYENAKSPYLYKVDSPTDDLEEIDKEFEVVKNQTFGEDNNALKTILTTIAISLFGFNNRQYQKTLKQGTGSEFFTSEPWTDEVIKQWVTRNTNLITNLTNEYRKKINDTVLNAFQNRETISTLSKKLTNINKEFSNAGFKTITINGRKFKIKKQSRADLIARDQLEKLNSQVVQRRQEQVGVQFYIWHTAFDERVRGRPGGRYPNARPSHWAMEGKVGRWDDSTLYADSVQDAIDGNWKSRSSIGAVQLHPGQDINCFLGNTKVRSFIPVQKLYRRRYRGEATKFITNNGETFVCTPNHPILRFDGIMVPAKDLQVSDDIINIPFQTFHSFGECDKENRIPTFEQIFNFFESLVFSNRVIGSLNNFHGDGIIDEDIDIIDFETELKDSIKSILNKDVIEKFFTHADSALSFLTPNRFCYFMLSSMGFSSQSFISFFSKLFPFFKGHFIESNEISLRTISQLNLIFNKDISNGITADLVFFGKTQNTLSFDVFFNDIFIRKLLHIGGMSIMMDNIKPHRSELFRKIVTIDSKNFTDFPQIFSGFHHTISIKEKSVIELDVHVYNLQNKNSWYSITDSNLIVKNCRCWAEAVFENITNEVNKELK